MASGLVRLVARVSSDWVEAHVEIQRTGKRSFPAAPERIIDPKKAYKALMKTSKGDITI